MTSPVIHQVKIRGQLFNYWACFHILFIVVVCSYSAYNKYCKFYQVSESSPIKKINNALFSNAPMVLYGRFTGTGVGYGFFAPNIKAGGIILGDCDGDKIGANFKNFESMMRFSVLATRVTDYLINPNDTARIGSKALQEKYYDLIFKSIAVKIYNQNRCVTDTSYLSYSIFQFPTLAAYRKGYRGYTLKKMKEVRLIKRQR